MTIKILELRAARLLIGGSLALLFVMLSGCAASRAFNQGLDLVKGGDWESGLAKLEEAVSRDPKNAEYRITLANQRASLVSRALHVADNALTEGRLDDASAKYQIAARIEPSNARARQGLDAAQRETRLIKRLDEVEAALKKGGESDLGSASEGLREVFQTSPNNPRAKALKARLEQLQQDQVRPDVRLSNVYKKPITLEFRDAPIKSVFDLIAKISGLNFYFDKEVKSDIRTTILAKNTPIDDAVRLVLVSNQLEQKVLNGNSILIYPSTPAKLKEYQTLVVRSFYVVNADVKSVVNTIKTIVKTKDIVFDERVGVIIVRDTPQAVRMAERIVALQDVTDPEVMLEVEVMEIKRSRLMELGIQWPSQVTLSPLTEGSSPLTLAKLRAMNSSTIQVGLGNTNVNLRKEDQDSNILANPRIRVRNKEKAKILIGDKVPVITSTSTATGFTAESVSYIDVGLKLDVEPNIYLDDEVAIKVNLEVSNLVREIISKSGALSYQIGTRGANTVLRLKDGETQILAGLISDEDRSTANKIPGLGEMPLLGRLFGSQKDDTQRNEILLSITPRVVRSIKKPELALAEFESGTEASIGAESLRLVGLPVSKSGDGKSAKAGSAPVETNSDAAEVDDQLSFSWQAPDRVKVGEVVTASLHVNTQGSVQHLPMLLRVDPQCWEIVAVNEGSFMAQKGQATGFSSQADAQSGRIVISAEQLAASQTQVGATGHGEVLALSLRARKAAPEGSLIQLLSASPNPMPQSSLRLPIERLVRIEP